MPLWTGGYEHYAFFGGRGGAKSHSIAEAVVGLSCQREERVVCGRQFQNSIKDSVRELLLQKVQKMGMAAYFTVTETELINVATKSRFSFTGMDRNPDSVKSLEGATIFWGEEAQTFTRRSVEIILPTIRSGRARFVWGWNPRFRTDIIDDMFRGKAPPDKAYVKQVSWRDNPYFYQTRMPSEMARSLKANPKRHTHIWEGGYDENPDAAIFTNWRIGRVDVPDKCIPRFGMDFGFSADPNFVVKLYVIEELGVIYIAQESCGYHVPNRDIPAMLDEFHGIRNYPITADSARPETIEYLQSKGFNIYGARKGPGSIKNGITWLQGYDVVISPDCPILAEEFRTYTWKLDPNGKPLPMPAEHQQDHGIDAVRYAVEESSLSDQSGNGDGDFFII